MYLFTEAEPCSFAKKGICVVQKLLLCVVMGCHIYAGFTGGEREGRTTRT